MAGWIAAGASLVGDLISQQGGKDSNAQSLANQKQAEQWQEFMSDTSMQRRTEDLRRANLNPLLAIQQGGASTPGISPATAQNPNAAFGNLGGQISNAEAVAAQVKQAEAQTALLGAQKDKTISETPKGQGEITTGEDGLQTVSVPSGPSHELGDATVAQIRAVTGVQDAQAQQVQANIKYIEQEVLESKADQGTAEAQARLVKMQELLASQQRDIVAATKQYLIMEQQAKGAEARNTVDVMGGKFGDVIKVTNEVLKPVATATDVATSFSPSRVITHRGGYRP